METAIIASSDSLSGLSHSVGFLFGDQEEAIILFGKLGDCLFSSDVWSVIYLALFKIVLKILIGFFQDILLWAFSLMIISLLCLVELVICQENFFSTKLCLIPDFQTLLLVFGIFLLIFQVLETSFQWQDLIHLDGKRIQLIFSFLKKKIECFNSFADIDLLVQEHIVSSSGETAQIRVRKELFTVDFNEISLGKKLGKGGSNAIACWKGQDV